jgi:hypothetical protein
MGYFRLAQGRLPANATSYPGTFTISAVDPYRELCFYRAGDASSLAGCFARDAADVPVRIECEQGLRLELEVVSHRPRKKEFRKEHSARDDRRRRLLSYRDTATPWPELTLPGSG